MYRVIARVIKDGKRVGFLVKEIGKEDLIPKDYTGYLRFEISIDKNKHIQVN